MENTMQYKNYKAEINFSGEDDVFYGKLLGVNDLVLFESDSVNGLKKAFEETVEDYLETCTTLNKAIK
jgi:predicted HicB family RNase H-like nuclease